MNISDLQSLAYNQARLSGFHPDDDRTTFGDRIALIHSEASEALEAFRDLGHTKPMLDGQKPVGVPSELADVVIRVADLAESYGVDLERAILDKLAFNKTRPYRHGNKRL